MRTFDIYGHPRNPREEKLDIFWLGGAIFLVFGFASRALSVDREFHGLWLLAGWMAVGWYRSSTKTERLRRTVENERWERACLVCEKCADGLSFSGLPLTGHESHEDGSKCCSALGFLDNGVMAMRGVHVADRGLRSATSCVLGIPAERAGLGSLRIDDRGSV